MDPVVIENPIINLPFDEPTRRFRFDEDGTTIRDRLRVLWPNDPENYDRQ